MPKVRLGRQRPHQTFNSNTPAYELDTLVQIVPKLEWELSNDKLKADRPHPRDYPPTPPDYRHTDKQESWDRHTNGRTDGTNSIISLLHGR